MNQNSSSNIAESVDLARQNISNSCLKAQRNSDEVTLLAVSKTKPLNDVIAAYHAGQRSFGENYVQEGVDKIQQSSEFSDIEWHFIGPLQSNKTKLVAENFHWCQTIERSKIAQRLNDQRPDAMPALNVCIQINIDDEKSKSGVTPTDALPLAETISQLNNLQLRGIMAIPAKASSAQEQQQSFNQMKQLFEQLRLKYPTVDTLSLGMSGDMDAAIKAGSTMVRIGTAIFGAREVKQ